MIDFLGLKNELKNTEYAALCLCGSDRWLKLKCVSTICDVYQIPNDSYNVETLEEPTYEQIETACCSLSLFCAKKLVVCERFTFPQGKQMQTLADKFTRLINAADGTFCLVFFADAPAGFDKIKNLTFVNCDKLDSNNIVKWIVAYCKRQGVVVDPICARRISDYCLQDMSRVATETQKLIDYGEISPASIDLLVHKDTEYQIFNISRTIFAKNAQATLELYRGLIASGEEARGVFGLLYNTYRRAYYVKTSDLPNDKLAEYLAVKPFAVEKAKELAAGYKPMQLKRILNVFEKADLQLKAFLDETEVMTTLLLQLISM